MEVHRQQCQACQSFETRNILTREAGQPQKVYVRCGQCGELVAWYVLSEYYHHGRGMESFLRSRGFAAENSGRELREQFERQQREAIDGYQRAMDQLTMDQKSL